MKHSRLLMVAALATASATGTLSAQDVNLKKYPDYSPVLKVDKKLVATQSATERPAYVNNAETPYFPPVINQVGGSCGSASRIYYMFTYEINRLRGVKGTLAENQYPTHFTWLYTNSNSSKDGMAIANGVPNNTTYGGQLYSKLFGIQDCADPDFGWMQGYDKWYSAMFNRLERTANFPQSVQSEAGREAVKQWLWNHGGDPNYPGGGICGIGVASACTQGTIPATATNKAIGASGKKYVTVWGKQVDHALTIVGYDDRIEFDLDGNGIAGEKDKDEVGAWIIVNSWGNSWANKGFIYCPYKNAVTNATGNSYYAPEIYYIRRDYRPLRTMRVKMDYSKRSELRLSAGISEDLNATEPSKTTLFEAFKYAGDGDGNGVDAETPMLGRWADGMHYEPMEFGYDLTDLSAGFNTRKPLKYFFIIESKSSADGEGHVYDCSVIDYEFDRLGIETPCQIDKSGVKIENKGKKTIISFVVAGESFNAPRNFVKVGDNLQWDAPATSSYKLQSYNIYRNDTLVEQLQPGTLTYTPRAGHDSYQICAAYAFNDSTILSPRVDAPSGTFYGKAVGSGNRVRVFTNSGLTIKDIFKEQRPQATIEYWIRPNSVTDYNQQIGPGWGNLLIHTTSSGELMAGWSTSARVEAPAKTLQVGKWTHVAVVFNGGTCTVYANGNKIGEVTSGQNGIGGFGDLTIGSNSANGINGRLDEFRVWNTARTQREIQSMMHAEVADPENTPGLLCELKMHEINVNNTIDATGHYSIVKQAGTQSYMVDNNVFKDTRVLAADFSIPENITTGMTVTPVNNSSANAVSSTWNIDGKQTLVLDAPTVIFNEVGQHTISLEVADLNGNTQKAEKTFNVSAQAKPNALFTTPGDVAVGKRISFTNATDPIDGCSYEWSMPGSTQETANTINAATSYEEAGVYTVTLKATNAAGTSTYSTQVIVSNQVPTPAFDVTPNVIVKGETAKLKDESSNQPASWDWTVENADHYLTYSGSTADATLQDAGIYNVTLTASNALGSKSLTTQRAITVCNADAETGLNFRGTGETVTFNTPLDLTDKAFTVEWWMYAQNTHDDAQHIGGTKSDFLINTDADGALVVTMKGISYNTAANFVVPSEWHHYAVSFDKGDIHVYKDGKLTNTFLTPWIDVMPTLPAKMTLGGSDAPMNAIVDEFRVWNKALDVQTLKTYANAPITDVKKAMNEDKLALYYDFNQSSGNVNDLTSNANTGARVGFGPDGDAWTTSLGVFSLSNVKRLDVTADYLNNYAAPFLHTEKRITNEEGMENLVSLLTDDAQSSWILENPTLKGDTISTTVAVDTENGDQMTLWTKTGEFSSRVYDHKLFQTVTLPAGHYVFGFEYGNGDIDSESNIVVAKGSTLPKKGVLRTQALAYTTTNNGELAFDLDEPTEISLGLVLNSRGEMVQYFKRFFLERKITNQEGDVTGIELPTAGSESALTFSVQEGGISLKAATGTNVRIVTLSGVSLYNAYVTGTRFVSLPKGIYLVNGKKVLVP